MRPARALTAEVWVKLQRPEGDLVCKNTAYMLRLDGAMAAYLHIDGQWRVIHGSRNRCVLKMAFGYFVVESGDIAHSPDVIQVLNLA